MSEDLGELVKQYQKRSEPVYYIIAFCGGVLLSWIIPIIIDNVVGGVGLFFLIIPGLDFVFLIFLIILYNILKDTAKIKLKKRLDQELIAWKMQAVEDTIKSIETAAPVPLMNIETYSHDILYQKLSTEYPSINLQKLKILFPNTIYILQLVLEQKPFLGTYHQVEQQFVKNLVNQTKY